jgi:hypothetical protein
MTRDDFTAALEEQLRLRGLSFSRAAVLDFVASVWALAEDDNAVEVTERQAAGLEGPFQPAVSSPARIACTPSPSKWSLAR